MHRPKRSRKRHNPYPARGTPAGDAVVGTCSHCGETLHRGDIFFTPLTGKLLCLAGWQEPIETPKWFCTTCGKETSEGVSECYVCEKWWHENPPPAEPEPEQLIWDGDFPS